MNSDNPTTDEKCPRCGQPLAEVATTASGRKLQRCSAGQWNPETRRTEGCSFVKWLPVEPVLLDEKCPKCGAQLVLATTRFGKKLKKCSTNGWDKEKREPTGCDFVEWIKGTTQALDEKCPKCGENLVFYTTSSGKKMKKCSTSSWDREKRQPTGCSYVYWLKPGEPTGTGEEFSPPES